METYATKMFDDEYEIRASWGDPSCAIERMTEDGWEPTGRQVSDFRHMPADAMRQELEAVIRAGGGDPADFERKISRALADMR